ncbi:ER membrane glycoprotein subunit of the GPI transamidase complex-like protein [Spiromyces aspiralis]|uniref:ER membrane glycoprotein subunit of the GPI transamidase complex-like protein n=1 Tax=Spiromyces aspiralis TaxID=68401 RepID=A0ACC1HV35_9FUNG|nr:ER membrane glycoprotein subunit of the GPI transamidase complex-like protein [Spiromyces aspiralis]
MFENEHAFFPLVPLAIRAVKQAVFDWLLPANSVGQDLSFVLAGITISNLSFVGAAVLLYRLSCKVFDDEPFAYLAGVCYCFLPASIFMSAVYTESTFALISFGAMLLVVKRRYWYAAVATGVSTLCRANGIFYIGFFVWDLLIAGRPWSRSSGCRTVTTVASIACLALVASSGYIGFQYYGYRSFCLAAGSRAPDRPSWCESSIPLLYGYVQDRYWNVGFLRYFTLMQLPNFGLALPMLLLSVFGICEYAGHDLARFFSLGTASSPLQDGNADGSGSSDNRDHSCYFKSSALPFIYLWAVLLALSFFVMHVQVITRLFSSVPPVYWYAAHVLTRPTAKLPASSLWKRLVLSIHPSRWVLNYFILYSAVGATLFSAFYPPA